MGNDMRATGTKVKVLKEGRALLQKHGYNGFSFQDIANILEIKKPSLYDHYSSKEELMIAILQDYGSLFDQWTLKVKDLPATEKIKQVFNVFYSFSCDGKKVCPVLALIGDLKVLSKPVQNAMKKFIDHWLEWLTQVLKDGQADKSITSKVSPQILSQVIYSQIMGAQFQARIKNDPDLILESSKVVITLLSVG